ncbi:hypothetical protein Syun_018655 [Stephania yunnanensis]|uniref:Uncharacterized protein n=1 Tax=Stephania yunnanensis TaxID=152371 RepID=A0AAP0IU67_9MAGN
MTRLSPPSARYRVSAYKPSANLPHACPPAPSPAAAVCNLVRRFSWSSASEAPRCHYCSPTSHPAGHPQRCLVSRRPLHRRLGGSFDPRRPRWSTAAPRLRSTLKPMVLVAFTTAPPLHIVAHHIRSTAATAAHPHQIRRCRSWTPYPIRSLMFAWPCNMTHLLMRPENTVSTLPDYSVVLTLPHQNMFLAVLGEGQRPGSMRRCGAVLARVRSRGVDGEEPAEKVAEDEEGGEGVDLSMA